VWCVVDGHALDSELRARVLGAELARRRPDCTVRTFSAAQSAEVYTVNALEPVVRLHGHGAPHARELAAGLDLVVSSFDTDDLERVPPEIVSLLAGGPGAPARHAAFAIGIDAVAGAVAIDALAASERITVLDDGSPDHWRAHSGRELDGRLSHPGVLAPRWFSDRLLIARREFLRAIDAWPGEDGPLIVQGGPEALRLVERIGTLGTRPIVALDARAEDAAFSAAVVAAVPGSRRLPDSAGVEDRVAAIAGASEVLASSAAVRAVARAFGIASSTLEREPDATSVTRDAIAALDDELDLVAGLAPGTLPGALAWSELEVARRALDARGNRLNAERVAFADAMVVERERYHELLAQHTALQAGYDDIRQLEVVRWRFALANLRRRVFRRQ
jgi:hypothetical protein